MKKLFLFLVSLLVFASIANAQGNTLNTANSQTTILTYMSDESVTIDGTAGGVGFTSSKINPSCTNCGPGTSKAQVAICVTESATGIFFRYRDTTGGTVTSANGQLYGAGVIFTIYGYTNISHAKFIRTASTSVPMFCSYYKYGAGPGQ